MMAVWSEIRTAELGESLRIDAEYYQPRYIQLEKTLRKSSPFDDLILYLTDGTHITPRYTNSGVPFLSSGNVHPFHLELDEVKYISEEEHQSLKHCQPQANDILLSKSGRIGHAAVVPKYVRKGDFNIYEGIALIRISEYDPYVLSAVLNSDIVQLQFSRRYKGVAQPHIHLEDIRRLRIPVLDKKTKSIIKNCVLQGIAKYQHAMGLYTRTEELLLEELGLKVLELPSTLFYKRPFSEIQQATRLDAEFFQPKFYYLIKAIHKTQQAARLGDILTHCERGLQPEYDEEGTVSVVNTKHIGAQFLSEEYERCTDESWELQKKAQLKQYDVLFYSTGAYIGRTNCWFKDTRAIGSNHVTIIRPNDECNPIYLSLFLNSKAGLIQADRHAHGSAQREVYPTDIRNFTIWLPTMEKQEEFAQMLLDSKAALDKSRYLLEEAKEIVKQAVLKGVI